MGRQIQFFCCCPDPRLIHLHHLAIVRHEAVDLDLRHRSFACRPRPTGPDRSSGRSAVSSATYASVSFSGRRTTRSPSSFPSAKCARDRHAQAAELAEHGSRASPPASACRGRDSCACRGRRRRRGRSSRWRVRPAASGRAYRVRSTIRAVSNWPQPSLNGTHMTIDG